MEGKKKSSSVVVSRLSSQGYFIYLKHHDYFLFNTDDAESLIN